SQAARCLEAQQYSSPAEKKGQEEPANSGGSESNSPAKNAEAVPRRLLVHSLFAAIGAVCSIAAVVYFLSSKDSSTSSSPSVAALSSPSALPSATAEPSPSASVSPSASPEPSSSADLPATVEETRTTRTERTAFRSHKKLPVVGEHDQRHRAGAPLYQERKRADCCFRRSQSVQRRDSWYRRHRVGLVDGPRSRLDRQSAVSLDTGPIDPELLPGHPRHSPGARMRTFFR